jgi:hypothetical protein
MRHRLAGFVALALVAQRDAAREHYRALVDLMDPASDRPELSEARQFATGG